MRGWLHVKEIREHMSSTLDVSRGCPHPQADRARSRPEMGARRLISGTGSKRLTGTSGVEDVGKQTLLDPMKTVRPRKSRLEPLEVSSLRT